MKGILFDDIHSYFDLNLIVAPFQIPPALPKTNTVDIKGANGSIDLTAALGEVFYKNRSASFTFSVLPEDDFEEKKTEVANLLNGRQCKITLDKDPDYYYIGRCSVNGYKADKMLRQITVNADLQPYKLKQNVTVVTVESGTHSLQNSRLAVVPTITTTAETILTFDGVEYELSAGTHKILEICLVQGFNQVTVETDGTVTFEYQEGAL